MVQKVCEACNKDFQAKRKEIKTCSPKCTALNKSRKASNPKVYPEPIKCLQCSVEFSPLHKNAVCCSNDCQNIRNKAKNLEYKNNAWGKQEYTLTCKNCSGQFKHHDRRKASCSFKCAYYLRALKMKSSLGYSNPSQKPRTYAQKNEIKEKTKKTVERLYGSDGVRTYKFVENLGYTSFSDFSKDVISFIEKNNTPPFSNSVISKFKCSTWPIRRALILENKINLLSGFSSNGETSLFLFIKDLLPNTNIHRNYRGGFLGNMELDIYLPDKNFAVEYHGLYYHSERNKYKSLRSIKTQHELKYLLCRKEGVHLIQIFEDEWRDKRPIVESIIKNKLGISSNKIFARKCEIREVDKITQYKFFADNHISGGVLQIKKAFGLYYNNELVSCLSLRTPFTKNKKGKMEIARLASKLDTVVVGGFQRLLKAVESYCRAQNYEELLTYADCRFGTGGVYSKSGFIYDGHNGPNYFYEQYGIREGRFAHRHKKDETGTERDQQNSKGWYAIYDAGNEVYHKSLINNLG